MVASRSRLELVPASLLHGASCLLAARPQLAPAPEPGVPAGGPTDLTPAERRVCELVLRGLSNKEIAAELGRAEPTIKNQVAAVLRKHGVPSRARLLALSRA